MCLFCFALFVDDVRSGTKAKARRGRLRAARESMGQKVLARDASQSGIHFLKCFKAFGMPLAQ